MVGTINGGTFCAGCQHFPATRVVCGEITLGELIDRCGTQRASTEKRSKQCEMLFKVLRPIWLWHMVIDLCSPLRRLIGSVSE